jgi:hypothetical protein
MAQANGSRFKLVYPHWINNGCSKPFPIANGLHIATVEWLQGLEIPELFERHLRVPYLDQFLQKTEFGLYFRHSNFIWHFLQNFPFENLIKETDIIDDGSIYIFPVEIELQGAVILANPYKFKINGIEYSYSFFNTITPGILKLMQTGKVKLLITNLVDASLLNSHIYEIETIIISHGIDPKNVILCQGNNSNSYHGFIKQISGALSLYQVANLIDKFPTFSDDLGYINDIVRESDLNLDVIRPKRFLCFNRSMNRPHRLAIAYIALKYNLLENSIFSFVTNKSQIIKKELGVYYANESNLNEMVKAIDKLIPYEIDTHHLSPLEKQGFQTVTNYKKEFYINTYMHITSETEFNTNTSPFFSEKTWRPILNLQPFIYVGNPHALKKLKELGFKTFSPFIDESYDLIEDHTLRLPAIEHEISRINSLPIEELHKWYYSIKDILIHNQQHIRNFKDYNPYEEVFKDGI